MIANVLVQTFLQEQPSSVCVFMFLYVYVLSPRLLYCNAIFLEKMITKLIL